MYIIFINYISSLNYGLASAIVSIVQLQLFECVSMCSICRGVGGLTPLVPLTPKFSLTPTGSIKKSQKYIADPLWFYHKSSTVCKQLEIIIEATLYVLCLFVDTLQ